MNDLTAPLVSMIECRFEDPNSKEPGGNLMSDRSLGPTPLRCAVLAGLLILAACSSREESRLSRLCPNLPRGIIPHLVHDSDHELSLYCTDLGSAELDVILMRLDLAMQGDSPEAWQSKAQALLPYLNRVCQRAAEDFAFGGARLHHEYLRTLDPSRGMLRGRLLRAKYNTYVDPSLTPSQKFDRLLSITDSLRQFGDRFQTGRTELLLAETALGLGELELAREHCLTSMHEAEGFDDPYQYAQALGFMSFLHSQHGEADSMLACLDGALEVALRSRNGYQAARLAHFLADHYRSLGRAGLSAEFRDLGLQYCRELKAGYHELRFLLQATRSHADHGCWELVLDNLSRVQVLLDEAPVAYRSEYNKYPLDADLLRARYLMSKGRVEEAQVIFRRIREPFRDFPHPFVYLQFLDHWCDGLLENGLSEDALPLIEDAMERARQLRAVEWLQDFGMMKARALLELGEISEADSILSGSQRESSDGGVLREWRPYYASFLDAKICLARGDSQDARSQIQDAYARLLSFLRQSDGSAESYLYVDKGKELRDLFHRIIGHDAERAYVVEMGWRSLWRELGSAGKEEGFGESRRAPDLRGTMTRPDILIPWSFLHAGEEAASGVRRWLARTGGLHLLYAVRSQDVIRWTVSPARITRDTLDTSADDLRELVHEVLSLTSRDPGDPDRLMGEELEGLLVRLGSVLLPMETLEAEVGRGRAPLLISVEGFLRHLPFAPLSLRTNRYEPALAKFNVAFLRSVGPRCEISNGPGLVFADPEPPDELRRRYPRLRRLPGGLVEARQVGAVRPGTAVLKGDRATKDDLTNRWEEAPFLYVAAHFVRDPENAYLTFLPMSCSGAGTEMREAARLEIIDIRSADLSGCDLVVLSGCETGTPPYLMESNGAPSLADAFVDAGARAAINTFWSVRDEAALELMSEFIDSWGRGKEQPVVALSQARRSVMEGSRGITHPFTWGAYGLQLGTLDIGDLDGGSETRCDEAVAGKSRSPILQR